MVLREPSEHLRVLQNGQCLRLNLTRCLPKNTIHGRKLSSTSTLARLIRTIELSNMGNLRRFLVLFAVVCTVTAGFAIRPAFAVVEININKANVEPLPVAITDFQATDDLGAKISGVVEADLKRSGLFAPINRAASLRKSPIRTRPHGFRTGLPSTLRHW